MGPMLSHSRSAHTPKISSFIQPCPKSPRFFSLSLSSSFIAFILIPYCSLSEIKFGAMKRTRMRTKPLISAITPASKFIDLERTKYLLPAAVSLLSYSIFPDLVEFFISFLVPIEQGGPLTLGDYAVIINGLFIAAVGILFATQISLTISTLSQRLQDGRQLVFQELAMVRTLCIAIRNSNVIQSFDDFTKYFIIETFERKNKTYNVSEAEIGTEDALFKVMKSTSCRISSF